MEKGKTRKKGKVKSEKVMKAKSELHALVKVSSGVSALHSVITDAAVLENCALFATTPAQPGGVQRQGLERLRHVECTSIFAESLSARCVMYSTRK